MKLKQSERAVIAAALLALAVMGGFFWGRTSVAAPVRVITRTSSQSFQQPEDSGTGTAPDTAGEPSPDAGEAAFPININTATAEELLALPGVGPARAEAIVAYRQEHGPFAYVEDLRGVSGIGEKVLEDLMDYITVGEQNNG